jgi:hypothetical protein
MQDGTSQSDQVPDHVLMSRSRLWAFPKLSNSVPNWIRLGGRVANIGVHGEPATLYLEDP